MVKHVLLPILVAIVAGVILLYLEHNTDLFDPIKTNNPIIHEVKKGETLSGIANQYGVSIKNMVKDNNLKEEPIYQTVYEKKYKKVKDRYGKIRTFYRTVPVRKIVRYDYLVKEGQKLKVMK
ncbi:MAG: LysM peptidoglycan-binding domain-containing protein [Lewinellaceae bacterium]|nr:LysM peptidoglycan-binding domain-containing protein [Lewinellaceae bacterium]